jgi:hypothetical protein
LVRYCPLSLLISCALGSPSCADWQSVAAMEAALHMKSSEMVERDLLLGEGERTLTGPWAAIGRGVCSRAVDW